MIYRLHTNFGQIAQAVASHKLRTPSALIYLHTAERRVYAETWIRLTETNFYFFFHSIRSMGCVVADTFARCFRCANT